ncbi:MAG: DUF4091 domain-containing protein, partial [Clostridiales bacterium]|nr:DUF4091 domain-containing protein [Clostridiales bacterium]
KAGVTEYLKGYRIIDAMSDIEYYKSGVIEMPVPSIRVTDAFKEVNVKPLWTYYCITAGSHFSNRFFCYHSYQNRILGTQLYKYDVDGFLHWGYNFYNTQYSKKRINPYIVTDAGRAFSSGDAFSVYPGDDCCVESLRLVVFHECLQDMRALELLSSLIGREETENLIDEVAGMKVDLANYPKNAAFILALRKRVNETIKSKI